MAITLSGDGIARANLAADVIDSTKLADDAVDTEHLADDAVGVAELSATGTASSSTYLRGDNSWATAGFAVADITGATALAEQPAATDEIVISDGGTLKRLDIKHIMGTPACHAWLSADQTGLESSTQHKIAFNVEGFDSDGCYDNATNYRFTPGVAGYYWVYSCMRWDFGGASSTNHIYIRKNGTNLKQIGAAQSAADSAENRQTSTVCYLDADDYIEIFGRHNQGSNQMINGGTHSTHTGGTGEPGTVTAQLVCFRLTGV